MNRIALSLLAGVAGLTLASAAQAADLIVDTPAPAAPGYVETTGNWDGAFIGAFVGGGWGSFDPDADVDDDEIDVSGWLLGVDVGANFSLGSNVVAGVVGDIAWSNVTDDDDEIYNINWAGSVRGRLGLDAGTFLPYLTAGLAVAGAEIDGDEQTHVGWTAGAGVEVALADNLSLNAEYRYSDYGSADYDLGDDISLTSSQVTVGLHWKF